MKITIITLHIFYIYLGEQWAGRGRVVPGIQCEMPRNKTPEMGHQIPTSTNALNDTDNFFYVYYKNDNFSDQSIKK